MEITATSKGITVYGKTYHIPNTFFNIVRIVIMEILKKK